MERVLIEKNELIKIQNEFKQLNLTNRKIREIIGNSFEHSLYKGYSLPIKTFNKIEELLNRKIKHNLKNFKFDNGFHIEITELTAEFIGIMLGDGCISIFKKKNGYGYKIGISLDSRNDYYITYVISIINQLFNKNPKSQYRKNQNSVEIVIYGKNYVLELLRIGLKNGNKKENQVFVPDWIKKDNNFIIKCLKGLVDTDGSIYISKSPNILCISFKNSSIPLIFDFQWMCNKIGIKKLYNNKTNQIIISSKNEVSKFIEIVNPIKWIKIVNEHSDIINILKYVKK